MNELLESPDAQRQRMRAERDRLVGQIAPEQIEAYAAWLVDRLFEFDAEHPDPARVPLGPREDHIKSLAEEPRYSMGLLGVERYVTGRMPGRKHDIYIATAALAPGIVVGYHYKNPGVPIIVWQKP